MVADDDSGRQQQHARLGSGLQWGRTREGGERWWRQQSGNDGCSSRRWRQQTTRVVADNDGDGG
jgi:hypothetical protein